MDNKSSKQPEAHVELIDVADISLDDTYNIDNAAIKGAIRNMIQNSRNLGCITAHNNHDSHTDSHQNPEEENVYDDNKFKLSSTNP